MSEMPSERKAAFLSVGSAMACACVDCVCERRQVPRRNGVDAANSAGSVNCYDEQRHASERRTAHPDQPIFLPRGQADGRSIGQHATSMPPAEGRTGKRPGGIAGVVCAR